MARPPCAGALQALRRHLRHPAFASAEQGSFGSSVSESSTSGAEGRATQLVRRSAALGPLTVEVEEPHDRSRPARLHFRGRATQQDLDLMSAALQSAMQPRRHGAVEVRDQLPAFKSWRGAPAGSPASADPPHLAPWSTLAQELQEWGALFEGTPLGRHFESADPFLGHLREFIQGFERMAQGARWAASPPGLRAQPWCFCAPTRNTLKGPAWRCVCRRELAAGQ